MNKKLLDKVRKKQYVSLIDFQLIWFCYLLSFFLRFDLNLPIACLRLFLYTVPIVLTIKIITYIILNINKIIWRYVSLGDLILLIKVSTLNNLLYGLILFLLFRFEGFPRSVLIIDWFLYIMFMGGIRLLYRYSLKRIDKTYSNKKRCLIVGSRDAAEELIRAMITNKIDYLPLGILDNDSSKWNRYIHGVKIYGPVKDIYNLSKKLNIEEIIIAITSASTEEMRQILDHVSSCNELNVKYKTVPGINEILSGKKSVTALREIRLEDLLNRELVITDQIGVRNELNNEVVLVTGAAGSIGSELVRQILNCQPKHIILLDRNENALMYLEKEIESEIPKLNYLSRIVDITDEIRLDKIYQRYRPSYVFHAAAYKHVAYMEDAPDEAIKNNVLGTFITAKLAEKYDVKKFVLISTDKAVNPTSIMGCTKRLAELCLINSFKDSSTNYIIVRFGNVLGSEGSVIPIFKRQIEHGGPLTVTHPKMRRYFMTIPEAVRLTLYASHIGKHKDILILDMGEQISIVEVAENLIKLSGLKPYEDINITFTGIRPGEKLDEELWNQNEVPIATNHPKIYKTSEIDVEYKFEYKKFEELITMFMNHADNEEIKNRIKELVYKYNGNILNIDNTKINTKRSLKQNQKV